ncbi:UNVERIFIED_CONTAM: hypothetical protein RMT77_003090 [Armadillidium vulgare]
MYMLGWVFTLCYLCWSLIPHSYLKSLGITYLPQPYWALALPSFIVVSILVFVFFLYPSVNMNLTVSTSDIRTIKDKYSVAKDSYKELDHTVSPIYDIPISQVCHKLYGIHES